VGAVVNSPSIVRRRREWEMEQLKVYLVRCWSRCDVARVASGVSALAVRLARAGHRQTWATERVAL